MGYREFEKNKQNFKTVGRGEEEGAGRKRERVKTKNLRCPVFQSKVTEWIDTSLLLYTY